MIKKIKNLKLLLCLFLISIFIISFLNTNNSLAINNSNYISVDTTKKTVYLTFDDGPIPVVTDNILDVLKKYNVKATFFVVGKEIDGREKILNRISKEGHSIGLHTYSHKFKKIYSSNNAFIDEMLKTRTKVKDLTGFSSHIIRFPGGSYNHLNKNLLTQLHKNNFKIYDWNVNLEDGVNPRLSVNGLINNAKKYRKNNNRLIVLMHCNSNNKNTVKALPGIIKYYTSLGYEFDCITDNTEEYYYKIKNN